MHTWLDPLTRGVFLGPAGRRAFRLTLTSSLRRLNFEAEAIARRLSCSPLFELSSQSREQ
eukprot:3457669-Prymnesium_polylepis.1